MSASVEVVTFGCRLNGVESDVMRRAAEAAGHRDLVIVNTCAVTGEAVRQARQAIRRLRRERPNANIVVTGCAAEIDPKSFGDMDDTLRFVGNRLKTRPQTWRGLLSGSSENGEVSETAHHFVDASSGLEGHSRAFVEVQNGCDHRCTFCVIPFGRGPSRSAPVADIVAQARRLVDNGFAEVVLTGVDLTSYGADQEGSPRLGTLVCRVLAEVPGLARLRLSSLDCIEADDGLFEAMADPRFMPHLHLSLQAGDDVILKRMKRRHSFDDAVAFCRRVRGLRPDIVFGADIIAGFPTESEAMFQRSLDLVSACGLTHLHVFPYSARPGTPAARMPQLDSAIIKDRARRLREAGTRSLAAHLEAQKGRQLRVLGERGGMARAEDFTPVRGSGAEPGELRDVSIATHDGAVLVAA